MIVDLIQNPNAPFSKTKKTKLGKRAFTFFIRIKSRTFIQFIQRFILDLTLNEMNVKNVFDNGKINNMRHEKNNWNGVYRMNTKIMNRMKSKKTLPIIIAVALTLTLFLSLTAPAGAAQITSQLDFSENPDDDSGDGWSWNHDEKTLTLNDLDLAYDGDGSSLPAILLPADSILQLTGESRVNNTDGDGISASGDLTIQGEGTVSIDSWKDGIKAAGNATIHNGTVSVNSTDDAGINATGNITISNGTVTIASRTRGINASDSVTIDDGTVSITSTNARGIYAYNGPITINDGTISINSLDVGIYASDDSININGGTVSIDSRDGGMSAYEDVTINGGTVTIDTSWGCGIAARNDFTIRGGTLSISITDEHHGITADNIIISGGSGTIETIEAFGHNWAVASRSDLSVDNVSVKGWDGAGYTVPVSVALVSSGNYTFVSGENTPQTNIQFSGGAPGGGRSGGSGTDRATIIEGESPVNTPPATPQPEDPQPETNNSTTDTNQTVNSNSQNSGTRSGNSEAMGGGISTTTLAVVGSVSAVFVLGGGFFLYTKFGK